MLQGKKDSDIAPNPSGMVCVIQNVWRFLFYRKDLVRFVVQISGYKAEKPYCRYKVCWV